MITVENLRKPKWIRYKTTYPLSTNEKDRYFKYDFEDPKIIRHYRTKPIEGYNKDFPSIMPMRVRFDVKDLVITRSR